MTMTTPAGHQEPLSLPLPEKPRPLPDEIQPSRRFPLLALAWILGHAILRLWWQVGGQPGQLSAIGTDLVIFNGWPAVALLVLAGAAVVALMSVSRARQRQTRWVIIIAAIALGLAVIAPAAMLLLDVVGLLVPGVGIAFYPLGILSRAGMAGSGVLVLIMARNQARLLRGSCLRCGQHAASPPRPSRTRPWALLAGYLAVLGCLVRLVAQSVVGFGANPLTNGGMQHVFEAGFLLAGVLLPLALVHRWGRVWPFWVPGLAGRRVPRWLVLGPGAGLGCAMVVYFGLTFAQMVSERLQGRNPFPPAGGIDLPEAFFWVSIPAYLLWGIGLVLAARSYAAVTRPDCRPCGR